MSNDIDVSEAFAILLGMVIVAVFLLFFQSACVEHTQDNDAYYLEKLRIEKGLYNK